MSLCHNLNDPVIVSGDSVIDYGAVMVVFASGAVEAIEAWPYKMSDKIIFKDLYWTVVRVPKYNLKLP